MVTMDHFSFEWPGIVLELIESAMDVAVGEQVIKGLHPLIVGQIT